MNEEVAVIEQDPFPGVVSFRADRQFAKFLELFADLVGDRLSLARIRRRADHEIVGERSNFAEIEHQEIFGFFGFGGARGNQPARQFGGEGALMAQCDISEF